MLHETFFSPTLRGMKNDDLKSRSNRRLNNRRLAHLTGQADATISDKLRGRPGYPLGAREALPIAVAEVVSDDDWQAILERFEAVLAEFGDIS